MTRDFHVACCIAQVVARTQEETALETEGEPVTAGERLKALLTRFHCVLAPHASWRREVVPAPPAPEPAACSTTPPTEAASPSLAAASPADDKPAPSRIPWA